ncbi:MAG: HypC/HybG/HupF family hydrogenase formation chaperone [Candidatus Cyclonatronum sp.]|uniref:HypC/HybG/HupF family hydrogenase formation chaperone n=1 Tax=Cyclonatronum sp. TaxID=3024185 RepID=UPI0025BD7B0D|nr:HypC/HybG/HupF family hydrogenase formation chaperone [Cyclonatronum sp.]MCC5932971.1 HypC/HybG/HupF family hydrogenase formation chaperone [Balneolales bacterium]MCH8485312.1 HypC/HybG/HupF family hydrogenase formation chaperone [Cyclonatronum sp.]
MCLAIPGKVLSVSPVADEVNRPAVVSFGGIRRDVNLCFVPQAQPGDYVLVHVGVALSVVDEAEAEETFRYLKQIGELDELGPESEEAPGSPAPQKARPAPPKSAQA